jgi:hypothetical protein
MTAPAAPQTRSGRSRPPSTGPTTLVCQFAYVHGNPTVHVLKSRWHHPPTLTHTPVYLVRDPGPVSFNDHKKHGRVPL